MSSYLDDDSFQDALSTFCRAQDDPWSAEKSLGTSRNPRSDKFTKEDWLEHGREIYDMYIRRDMHLWQVKACMEERYGFVKTERQYKEKFRAMKISKHIKGWKLGGIAIKDEERLAQGKISEYKVNGVPVKANQLSAMKRKLVLAGRCQRTPSECITAVLSGVECITIEDNGLRHCGCSQEERDPTGSLSITEWGSRDDEMLSFWKRIEQFNPSSTLSGSQFGSHLSFPFDQEPVASLQDFDQTILPLMGQPDNNSTLHRDESAVMEMIWEWPESLEHAGLVV